MKKILALPVIEYNIRDIRPHKPFYIKGDKDVLGNYKGNITKNLNDQNQYQMFGNIKMGMPVIYEW